MKKMNKKGFTLIELLAVILILGIISLIAIPMVNSVIMRSRVGAWQQTANSVKNTYENRVKMCEIQAGCSGIVFKESPAEGTDENDMSGATVKRVLEMSGKLPANFDTLKLTTLGEAIIAFKEDNVACYNYGNSSTDEPVYPTTVGDSVSESTELFDMLCFSVDELKEAE